jgi:hypothetical protein
MTVDSMLFHPRKCRPSINVLVGGAPAVVVEDLPPIRLRAHDAGADVTLPGALWSRAALAAALSGGSGGYVGGFRLLTRNNEQIAGLRPRTPTCTATTRSTWPGSVVHRTRGTTVRRSWS